MNTSWTQPAIADLDNLVRHIAKDNIAAAFRTEDRILAAVARLETYPASAAAGRRGYTRELAVGQTPYVVIYRVGAEIVEILRGMHGAQDRRSK